MACSLIAFVSFSSRGLLRVAETTYGRKVNYHEPVINRSSKPSYLHFSAGNRHKKSVEMFFVDPPPHPHLSAKYKGTYAYKTVKDRMPVILTKAIDYFCRNKKELEASYGENAVEDSKDVIGKLSKLRSEMQTNKPLIPVCESILNDAHLWNPPFSAQTIKWFDSPWLLVECYMYRAIWAAINESPSLKGLDPFQEVKQEAYGNHKEVSYTVAAYTLSILDKSAHTNEELKDHFIEHMEIALWGNRNDLSVSAGSTQSKTSSIVGDTQKLRSHILVNHSENVWSYVDELRRTNQTGELTIILDNTGLEFVADLCFAVFCLTRQFFSKVNFHVKRIPWFVSDVTVQDFHWTLDQMKSDSSNDGVLRTIAEKCHDYLINKQIEIVEELFWTSPLPYYVMPKEDPQLHEKLAQSKLLLFKGDLNYRKLGADLNWPPTTPFEELLQGFKPAPLVAIRTVKAEMISDLPPGKVDEMIATDKDWMENGDYGVIQFVK